MNRLRALGSALVAVLTGAGVSAAAQTIDQQRAAVVRVTAVLDGATKIGTGFIVRLDADTVYILTASHVVEGDKRPRVEFFTQQNLPVQAETVSLEGGDPRGLALLLVRGKDNLAPGIAALPLAEGSNLGGGEAVTTIGFPQGGGPWAVLPATVVSRAGRDLTLAGAIDAGNSGGPVLLNGAVVGVVTGERGKFGLAVPVEIARITLEGWGVRPKPSELQTARSQTAPPAKTAEAASPETNTTDSVSRQAPPQPTRPQSSDALSPGQIIKDCADCPELVVVPAGRFTMGSPQNEAGRDSDEGPTHEVALARALAVGKYEVTRGQFARFVTDTKRDTSGGCAVWDKKDGKVKLDAARSWRDPGFAQNDDHPVVCVSDEDAKAYVEWLSGKTGKAYRLLSEAEWEYAARAGSTASRFWGEAESAACSFANVRDRTTKRKHGWSAFDCEDGYAETAPVGGFKPNAFGLYDMLGNAGEWVEDCYHDSYNDAPADGSAWLSGECESRVHRGSGWDFKPRDVRSANRNRIDPDRRNDVVGFRVARTLP